MIPSDLNIEEFAKGLATQAGELFPPELPAVLKKTVTQTVYNFIKIAGNALNNEPREYNQDETILVCQLVGEWMYHKGIDNYKNQIPQEYWEPILQQIAFAIFESSKNAVNNGESQDNVISIAENAVKSRYRELIEQLARENKLAKPVDEILNQSNLQDYVEQSYQEENITPVQEERDLKLMTMALFFKSLSPQEVGRIIKNLGEEERRQLGTYMEMPDLEKLVDPMIYTQYLEKFHNFMPKVRDKKKKKAMFDQMASTFSHIEKSTLQQIIYRERKNVKNFLLRLYDGKISEDNIFSQDVMKIIIEHTEQKINK